jgi:NAD-dependent SIR2 family protein deacetylase
MNSHSESVAEACEAIACADGLIIGAGAGMGVDSDLPDFRGRTGFWGAYPALARAKIDFTEIANPAAFLREPRLAWGFYGHRLNLYRNTDPHEGYSILRGIGRALPRGAMVFTSNVDGHFAKAGFAEDRILECHGSIHYLQCTEPCSRQLISAAALSLHIDPDRCLALGELPECPLCGGLLRPNILMFGDWQWLPDRMHEQEAVVAPLLNAMHRPVVIECGAGLSIPTVRMFCESQRAFLVRINPGEAQLNGAQGVSLHCGALEGLRALEQGLQTGGTSTRI